MKPPLPPKDFTEGWTLLVAQPYGAAYRREPEAEKIQRRCWRQAFHDAPATAWREAVTFWIQHEDHFPLIPEMRRHVTRYTPPPAPPDCPALGMGACVPVDQGDIVSYAERHGCTVFEAVKHWQAVQAWVEAGRPHAPGTPTA